MNSATVALKVFELGDSPSVHRWFNSPRATRGLLEQRAGFSVADAEAWTRRASENRGEDRKFAIVVAGHDEPVGFTALYGLFRQTAPELGVLIGDRVGGTGVGRAAEAMTILRAFDEFGAHRVYGRIAASNKAAKWVVASLGWQHEATLRGHLRRDGGDPEDCEIWGVLPEQFREAAADLLEAEA